MSHPTASPASAAQLHRIAHVLEVPVEDLAGLREVPAEDLRTLHHQISESIFGPGRPRFARVAALSEKLPATASGRLAERFLPPMLAAQVSVELRPAKARELVSRVSLDYLADLSVELDPSRAAGVVRALPADRVGEIAGALFARKEYAALAEFAAVVEPEALRAALAAGSAEDLLALAPLLDWNEELAEVVVDVDDERIDQLLRAIVDGGRREAAELLASGVPDEVRQRLIARAGDHLEMLAELESAVERGDLTGSAADLVVEARRQVG